MTKLNSAGTALVYSTYIGGSSNESGYSIAVDSSGNAYITGYTNSANFPTTAGADQTLFGGGSGDAFVTKLNSAGTVLYSTYLGRSNWDYGYGIAVDSSGNAYITGFTADIAGTNSSINFPTTAGAYQTLFGGGYSDAFVSKLNFPTDTTTTTTTTTTSTNTFEGTYTTTGLTIHLGHSSTTLSGTFSTGSLSGNLGGFVDSNGRAYVWAWFDSQTEGSAALAGSLSFDFVGTSTGSASESRGTFSFGGGKSSGGTLSDFVLSGMTKSSLSGSTTTSNSSTSTASYAGTYTTSGLTIILTQAGSTLTGAFSAGSLSGNLGGFVDSSGRAYVWAWYDSQTAGSAALAGGLSVSGNQGTFSFGGGQSSGGRISDFVLSNMARQ